VLQHHASDASAGHHFDFLSKESLCSRRQSRFVRLNELTEFGLLLKTNSDGGSLTFGGGNFFCSVVLWCSLGRHGPDLFWTEGL
jgi:hypothetical protein